MQNPRLRLNLQASFFPSFTETWLKSKLMPSNPGYQLLVPAFGRTRSPITDRTTSFMTVRSIDLVLLREEEVPGLPKFARDEPPLLLGA